MYNACGACKSYQMTSLHNSMAIIVWTYLQFNRQTNKRLLYGTNTYLIWYSKNMLTIGKGKAFIIINSAIALELNTQLRLKWASACSLHSSLTSRIYFKGLRCWWFFHNILHTFLVAQKLKLRCCWCHNSITLIISNSI